MLSFSLNVTHFFLLTISIIKTIEKMVKSFLHIRIIGLAFPHLSPRMGKSFRRLSRGGAQFSVKGRTQPLWGKWSGIEGCFLVKLSEFVFVGSQPYGLFLRKNK
jgi:hypothetical protein